MKAKRIQAGKPERYPRAHAAARPTPPDAHPPAGRRHHGRAAPVRGLGAGPRRRRVHAGRRPLRLRGHRAGHAHPAWSFIVPFDDRCRVRIDGRVIRSRPGQICAIGPGVPHEELRGEEPARYAAVFVAPRLLHRALRAPPRRGAPADARRALRGDARRSSAPSARSCSSTRRGSRAVAAIVDAAAVRLVHLMLRALLGVERLPDRVPEREGIRRAVELADDARRRSAHRAGPGARRRHVALPLLPRVQARDRADAPGRTCGARGSSARSGCSPPTTGP